MTDSLYEGIGGHPIPLTLTKGATTAVELDPARATLSGLFKQVLISELGAAWAQVTNSMDARWASTNPVEDVLELKPTAQVLQTRKTGFPMLAVYRSGRATFEDHTIAQDKMIQPWEVIWILGQATVEEQRKLTDFLVAGAKVIRLAVQRRGHPDYQSGALQFFPTTGGLGSVDIKAVETEPVRLNDDGQMDWLMMRMAIETTEYGKWDDGAFGNVDYMTLEMGSGDDTGTIPSFLNADSRYPESDPRP